MTRIEKKYLMQVCDAKDIICNACRFHHKDACDKCPIVNIIDNELNRLSKRKNKAYKEINAIFEADEISRHAKEE